MRRFIVSNVLLLLFLIGAAAGEFIVGASVLVYCLFCVAAWFAYRHSLETQKKMAYLDRQAHHFKTLFYQASDSCILLNDHAVVDCNDAALALFAVPSAALLASLDLGKLQPARQPDGSPSQDALQRKLNENLPCAGTNHFEWSFKSLEGREFVAAVAVHAIALEGESLRQMVIRDITEQKSAQSALRLASQAFDNALDGMAITDTDNRIVMVNPAFSTITGYTRDEVIGKNPRILSSGRQPPEFYTAMWETLTEQGQWQGEIWNIRKNGDIYPQWLNLSRIADGTGQVTHYLGVFSDISDRKNAESRVLHQVYHDQLTGLPNRVLFTDRLHQLFTQAKRHPENHIAVIYIDVALPDHDQARGEPGERLLKIIARRLSASLRESDTLARMNDDEFALLLNRIKTAEDAANVARKMLATFQDPFILEGELIHIPLSIGISVYPSDGTNWESLLQSATIAMRRAKKAGGSCYELFNTDLGARTQQRHAIEAGLQRALTHHELELYYQPQFECISGKLVGVEALLRWRHPEQGLVLPEAFLSVAEETGMIIPMGAWVLHTACAQAQAWRAQSDEHRLMAVNLSERQLRHPDLIKQVIAALNASGLPAHCLELEITENMIMHDMEANIAAMQTLSELGVEIALDDFGRGYSSFSYLKKMPIKALKIDKSFMHGVMGNANGVTTVDAIFAMAGALGLRVIVKGVEEQEQLASLRQHVQALGQGYLLGRPATARTITELLARQKSTAGDATGR